MCGIFGLIETDNHAPQTVFNGLKDIEYRGYDSWGVASWNVEGGMWKVEKEIGFLPTTLDLPSSSIALGHTRWATHGGVTKENAHPHTGCGMDLVLVHNGIVENYLDFKKKLNTHPFKSGTDSEIVAHLIETEIKNGHKLDKATANVFCKLEGLNAIVISNGEEIVACKNGSPLVVGKLKKGFALASDPNALLPLTNELVFLEDGQGVVLGKKSALIFDAKKFSKRPAKFQRFSWQHNSSSLADYPHFMLKEINEQPQVILNVLQNISGIEQVAKMIRKAFGTYFIGCGTAGYAALAGTYLFSKYAQKHVNFAVGSEFNYMEHYLTPRSLVIAISQSGETIDTVEPVMAARKKGSKIVAMINVLGSTLYRTADYPLLLQAGTEKAVASTKAMTAMLSTLIMLTFCLIGKRNEGEKILQSSLKELERILKGANKLSGLAEKIKDQKHIYILGRGFSYPVALESALKIKEISYIHAEGFAAGELKHGVIALIEKNTPVIVFVPEDETKGAVLSNAMEVKARGAYVVGVGVSDNPVFDFFFRISDCGASSIIPNIVFAQLLAYYLSTKLGFNPDKPRNLAKSVVVR